MNFGDLQSFGCVHKTNQFSDCIYLASGKIEGIACAALPTIGDMNGVFLVKGMP
jgi:hypothetical protein